MKFSENTINILKNFASINPSILVKPGNVIQTVAISNGGIFASASVEESFPLQFAIYKLPEFLGILSLFKDPEVEFTKHAIRIRQGNQYINYTMADASMVVAPPDGKQISLASVDVEFDITGDSIQRLIKAAAILQLPNICVKGDGEKITITATDVKTPTANEFSLDIGVTDKVFNMVFIVDNIIKLISNDYNVKISSKGISKFENFDNHITYFIANEASSNFNKG
jgi:hypothetical protein